MKRSTGTTDMMEYAKNAELAAPQFIQEDMFRIIIYRPGIEEKSGKEESRLESRLESLSEKLNSQLAAKVLLYIEQKESGKKELSKKLGHKTVSGELHKQIKELMNAALIEMTIPEKPTSRLQKYRLTEKGRELTKK